MRQVLVTDLHRFQRLNGSKVRKMKVGTVQKLHYINKGQKLFMFCGCADGTCAVLPSAPASLDFKEYFYAPNIYLLLVNP